jgi:predicted nuclease of restriction endonuclease-like (RecB) superfamily
VRELKRQKDAALFLRLAIGKSKQEVKKLAETGHIAKNSADVLRDPYIFEFLSLPEKSELRETKLEQKLIDNLQAFLLELGKGFTYVGRQYRITLNNEHFYVDLVFYHRILRCFVLLDLKAGKVRHQDIGQMNMYLGYFANEENIPGDNPPIGIILARDKNELLVQYATYEMNSQLFVAQYQLYLPDKEELRRRVEQVYLLEEENSEKT